MTSLLRRIALLETARRHDAPGPGLSGLLSWAQRHEPPDSWWTELGGLLATSPYRAEFEELPGLEGLLAEAIRWQEEHPR